MSKPERGVSRRIVLRHGVAAGLGLGLRPPLQAFAASGFDADAVEEAARALAARPYQPPPDTLPETLEKLDYDRYGKIKFRRGKALWRGAGPAFAVEFFHRGYLFKDRIAINEVVDGAVRPIRYDPSWFDLGDVPPPDGDAGLAGFRILTQPSGPHGKDEDMREAAVFLGASYFRAVAPGQNFGLSARGLALGSGEAGAEEFPVFREFWLERPAVSPHADARVLRIYALLDSPSVAGAYRFDLRAGTETVMDIDCMLFPRRDIANAGIAPLTSMFWFDPSRRGAIIGLC